MKDGVSYSYRSQGTISCAALFLLSPIGANIFFFELGMFRSLSDAFIFVVVVLVDSCITLAFVYTGWVYAGVLLRERIILGADSVKWINWHGRRQAEISFDQAVQLELVRHGNSGESGPECGTDYRTKLDRGRDVFYIIGQSDCIRFSSQLKGFNEVITELGKRFA